MSGRKVVTPHFEILRRGEVIKVVPLHRSRLVIGSEGGADLRLKHPAIAARHLEVGVVQGRYLEARNLAGEGRVLLAGQPMDQARLREGDELDLGPVTLRLTYHRSAKGSEAPVDRDEEQPTDADVTAPLDEDDEDADATIDEPIQAPEAPGESGPPAAPTGSRLGKRRRTPPGARNAGMDLELDDIVLDPAPLVTIEPPGGKLQRVPLRVGSFVVGGGRCAFRLSYPGIAPAHAEMMVMPDGLVYLKHLAGAGLVTLRNGAPIQFSRWKSGDRVQVGPVTMQLKMVPQDELAEVMSRPLEAPQHRKAPGALPRLEPTPTPPGRGKLVAAPRSSTLEPSSVPDPLSAQPWTEPPPRPPTPERAAPILREASPPPVEGPRTEPLSPPPSAEPPVAGTPPASSTPAAPLVRVHRKTDPGGKAPPKARPLKQASSPLVQANAVQISLDVRATDTYIAHARGDVGSTRADYDDDLLIDYRPAWWRRAGLPMLVGLLLAVICAQYLAYRDDQRPGPKRAGGPLIAGGETGVERDSLAADNSGGSRLVVGDPSRRAGRGTGGGGDAEWEPDVEGRFAEDTSSGNEYDALAKLAAARADSAIRESEESGSDDHLPSSSAGGAQGWVEMKEVEAVMWANRKALGYCQMMAHEDDPDLQGVLWLSLTLAADGRIRGAVVEPRSSIQNAGLLKCLQRQLFRLDMPTPRGGAVTFSYPFELAQ